MFSLSEIRAKARQTVESTPGIYTLAIIPVVLSVLIQIFSFVQRNNQFNSASLYGSEFIPRSLFGSFAFPVLCGILAALLMLSVTQTIFFVIRHKKETTSFKDALAIFNHPYFGKIFATFIVKQLLLLLWGILLVIGLFLLLMSILVPISFIITQGVTDTGQLPDEILGVISIFFILGLILFIGGIALYYPQYYAYYQVEPILFEQLEESRYAGPMAIIKESRRVMKGYKWKGFVLDLTFIGWFILVGISFGLVGIYVHPYYQATRIHFYDAISKDRAYKEALMMGKINPFEQTV
ncbi:DUF975 family protein [Streptococcus sp. X16XC17]|uniref:DUF975 family protein n=1 Tax=unclassified Streptococcus TaxID=2608887 RepID=UPI00066FC0A7|nr:MULTISPECIES: DUF975 family protein [unclassified Streptococcus]TCD46094.1 DUF975 family protein [Streptococcus sp. X16XC17]